MARARPSSSTPWRSPTTARNYSPSFSDTLLGLKPHSFLGWHLPCRSHPSQFRRVRAATLAPEGVTILFRRGQHMTGFARIVLTEQVCTADPVSMRSKTTSRTDIAPSLGFMTLQAAGPIWQCAWTGLRGIGFVYQCDRHSSGFRLIRDV